MQKRYTAKFMATLHELPYISGILAAIPSRSASGG